mmetsp:Transcript_35668/g.42979  ORF Transcript_35668/g.42979 Transcript_35668/m.42979 type:complete len:417 (+) Transcript_35668:28-1278(+)
MKSFHTTDSSKYRQSNATTKYVSTTAVQTKRHSLERENAAYTSCAEARHGKGNESFLKKRSDTREFDPKYCQRKPDYELNIKNIPRGKNSNNLIKFITNTMQERKLCEPGACPIVFCRRPRKFCGRLTSFVECATIEDANKALSLDGILFEGSTLSIYRRNDGNKLSTGVPKQNRSITCPAQVKHPDEVAVHAPVAPTSSGNEEVKRILTDTNKEEQDCTNLKVTAQNNFSTLRPELEPKKTLTETKNVEIWRLAHRNKAALVGLDSCACTNRISYPSQDSRTMDNHNKVTVGRFFDDQYVSSMEAELKIMESKISKLHCRHIQTIKLKDDRIHRLETELAQTRDDVLSRSLPNHNKKLYPKSPIRGIIVLKNKGNPYLKVILISFVMFLYICRTVLNQTTQSYTSNGSSTLIHYP